MAPLQPVQRAITPVIMGLQEADSSAAGADSCLGILWTYCLRIGTYLCTSPKSYLAGNTCFWKRCETVRALEGR